MVRQQAKSFPPAPELPGEELKARYARQKRWEAEVKEYQRLWNPIPIGQAKLNANLWEAEAIWIVDGTGKAVVSKAHELDVLLNRLFWAVHDTMEAGDPDNRAAADEPVELYKERKETLFASSREDRFKAELDSLIRDLEELLHPIVARHRA
jgi:hypothetical protein